MQRRNGRSLAGWLAGCIVLYPVIRVLLVGNTKAKQSKRQPNPMVDRGGTTDTRRRLAATRLV